MALFKSMRTEDQDHDPVLVKPSLGRRAANIAVRSVILISLVMSSVYAIALIVEPRDVDATVDGWAEVVAAGEKDTEALVATLDEPAVRNLLADPFFSGDDWTSFRVAVADEDREQVAAMRQQVIYSSQMLIWLHQRERLLDLASTMTLSLGSDERANLYAARALETVCSNGDREAITPMFELGPEGLADKVIGVAGRHCAPTVTPR